MRYRRWIAVMAMATSLGSTLPSQAVDLGKLMPGGRKRQAKKEQILACIKGRAWMAYFQDDEGKLAPVRDTLNTEDDEEWIGLKFTDFDGPRIRPRNPRELESR